MSNSKSLMLRVMAIFVSSQLLMIVQSSAEDVFNPRIIRVKGDVKILKQESQDWQAAEENEDIEVGSKINTGIDGVCDISFDQNLQNIMSVRSLSNAVITSTQPPYISISKGKYFALLDDLQGNKFSIESNVAVASVRGSALMVEYDPKFKKMEAAAFHHDTFIESDRFGDYVLPQGQAISISDSVGYGSSNIISIDHRVEWNEWSRSINQLRVSPLDSAGAIISDSNKAYYVFNPCTDVVPCTTQSSLDQKSNMKSNYLKQQNEKKDFLHREDLLLYIDDQMLPNSVVEMPYQESFVVLKFKSTDVELRGTMLFTVAASAATGKLKVQLYQAGKFQSETFFKNGKTRVVIGSGNPYGLRMTRVRVDEGVVALRMPWLCGGHGEYQTFEIEAGECYEQDLTGLPDPDLDDPDRVDEPPEPPDAATQNIPVIIPEGEIEIIV